MIYMLKTLIILLTLTIVGCSTVNFKNMSVEEIIVKTNKNMHVWAITEFEVTSTGNGDFINSGKWFLSSGRFYNSRESLNVHLSNQVVVEFKKKYGIKNVTELQGKKIRVTGTAVPKEFCVTVGCPDAISMNRPKMYIQTQLIIESIDNIQLL